VFDFMKATVHAIEANGESCSPLIRPNNLHKCKEERCEDKREVCMQKGNQQAVDSILVPRKATT